jgi:hypothetical protein
MKSRTLTCITPWQPNKQKSCFDQTVGLTFTGTAFSEPTLMKFISSFEHVIQARVVPQFLPTLRPQARPRTTANQPPH